jgi:hypothetical protein
MAGRGILHGPTIAFSFSGLRYLTLTVFAAGSIHQRFRHDLIGTIPFEIREDGLRRRCHAGSEAMPRSSLAARRRRSWCRHVAKLTSG